MRNGFGSNCPFLIEASSGTGKPWDGILLAAAHPVVRVTRFEPVGSDTQR